MKSKKVILFLAVSVLSLNLSACSSEENLPSEEITESAEDSLEYENGSPEETVKNFIEAYKTSYFETMNSFLENESLTFNSLAATKSQCTNLVIETITKNLKYKIIDSEIHENEAAVKVEMTNLAMNNLMMDTLTDFSQKILNLENSEAAKNFNEDEELTKTLREKIGDINTAKKVINTVTINLLKIDGNWKIVNNPAIFDAMSGDYISFINKNIQNFTTSEETSSATAE